MPNEDHFEYRVQPSCPIPNSHRRLEQAHRLWHQAMAAYGEPELFLANLNSTIEALRNVTFVLQAEKQQLAGFEEWYARWRAMLKEDPVSQWLNGARVTVVHKADLELTSVATVRVHNNLVLIIDDLQVPPMAPTALITKLLVETAPELYRSESASLVLAVERSWRVRELGDTELLEALSRAYATLRSIVEDAHQLWGNHCPPGTQERNSDGVLPCMAATVSLRTMRVTMAHGAPILTKKIQVDTSGTDRTDLTDRYGPLPVSPDGVSRTIEEHAEMLIGFGKRMLARDGFHGRFFHFFREGRIVALMQAESETRATKFALMREISDAAREHGADAIIDVAEAWEAPLTEYEISGEAQFAPSRREVFVITVARSNGKCSHWVTPFERASDNSIHFADTVYTDISFPPYLAALAEFWSLP